MCFYSPVKQQNQFVWFWLHKTLHVASSNHFNNTVDRSDCDLWSRCQYDMDTDRDHRELVGLPPHVKSLLCASFVDFLNPSTMFVVNSS